MSTLDFMKYSTDTLEKVFKLYFHLFPRTPKGVSMSTIVFDYINKYIT